MKIKISYPFVFMTAFLLGSAAFLLTMWLSQSRKEIPKEVVKNEVLNQSVEEIWKLETVEEIDIYTYDEEKPYPFKVKLLETGGFDGYDIKAKSGEIWLGLFKENDEYFLRPTKLKVGWLYEKNALTNEKIRRIGKDIRVKDRYEPIFLLKNADFLKKGKIKTLFKGMNYKEVHEFGNPNIAPMYQVTELNTGFSQKYEIGGKHYELKVMSVFTKNGYETCAIVLEGDGKRQIIPTGCQGLLFWVGDLDRDNKPDLFLQVSESDYFGEDVLFLSSPAEKGKIVKKVAVLSFSDSC